MYEVSAIYLKMVKHPTISGLLPDRKLENKISCDYAIVIAYISKDFVTRNE